VPADPAPDEITAVERHLMRGAEDLLGPDRAAELADRIAVLARQIALVSAAGAEPLFRWAGAVAPASAARSEDGHDG